jgi:hypothetical protein
MLGCGGLSHTAGRLNFPGMRVTGTIKNGVVKLPAGAAWPDGTKVRVVKVESSSAGNTLTRRLRELSSKVSGLPSDLAEKHDYYLHRTSRRTKS